MSSTPEHVPSETDAGAAPSDVNHDGTDATPQAPPAAADAPVAEQPAAEQSTPDAAPEPQAEQPAAEQSTPDAAPEPQAEQPAAEQPAAEQPASEAAEVGAEPPAVDVNSAEVDVDDDDEPDDDEHLDGSGYEASPEVLSHPAEAVAEDASAAEAPDEPAGQGKRRKKKKGEGQPAPEQRKRKGPEPSEVIARIGTSNERAMAYLAAPDPKLSRLSRKVIEALLPELPPVTAAALLGPAGFTRHLVASAAAGRYRDLFVLWETFRLYPAEAKPELAERGIALAKAQEKLKTAVRIGLTGRSLRLAEDVAKAEGLIWQWLREALVGFLPAVGARPAVASALLRREPALDVPMPDYPDERWLAEAASARQLAPLADKVERVLGAHVHRLPATVDTLRLATLHFPERVPALVDRVDLDAPDIGAFLAWARDHGAADRLHGRIRERVAGAAARDRVEGLSRWYAWQQRGVVLELPDALRTDSLEGFDLARPETAELAARLVARGVELDLQGQLDALAAQNRQLAEKAYEAMVCADLDVTLPTALENNPVVNPGTRCPKCRAWTWVRPGHESRCPRPEAPEPVPVLDQFELAAAETAPSDPQS